MIKFINYLWGYQTITLSPIQKNKKISILKSNTSLPMKYKITNITINNTDEIEASLILNNKVLLEIKDKYLSKKENILCQKDDCFLIKSKQNIDQIDVKLTIQPENNKHDDETLTLNTFLYNTVYFTHDIEKDLLKDKDDVGLCFSGGGPRSFSATLGYLRALHKFDILDKVKYVSCVSGSTWAWVPFTYVNDNMEQFLGLDIFDKDKLTLKDVEYTNEKYFGNSLINKAYNYQLTEYLCESLEYLGYQEKSRMYPYMLGKIFLEPYNLLDDKFFAPNQKIADIFNKPPLSTNIDYRVPSYQDRPFLICNTNTVKPDKKGTLVNTDFNLIEMTPLYSGTLSTLKTENREYGGHYLNSYSFSPLSYCQNVTKVDKDVRHFNLFDMMGASSTAYGIIMDLLDITFANPSYRLVDTKNDDVKSFDCIDGGVLDNAGIIPMLQRKVKKIVLFVNSNEKIDITNDDEKMTESIDIMIRQLFLGKDKVNVETYFHYFKYINDLKVFKDGEKRWRELLDKMRDNIEQKDIAFVEMENLEVMDNDNFHIKAYTVEKLQIIYLYESKAWKDRVSDDVVIPDNFPYYNTLFEDDGWIEKELLALTAPEVNLLADLTSYNLEHILKEPFLHLFE